MAHLERSRQREPRSRRPAAFRAIHSSKSTSSRISNVRLTFTIYAVLGLTAAFAQTSPAGKTEFQARCSGCHGDDGSGGGHGPNIIDVRQPRATTREALRDLIRKGI